MDGSGRQKRPRTWIVGPQEFPPEGPLALPPEALPTTADLQQALIDLAPILRDLGGAVVITADRMPHPRVDGVFINLRYIIKWESYVPARYPAEAEQPPPPAPPADPAELADPETEITPLDVPEQTEPTGIAEAVAAHNAGNDQ